MKKILIGAVLLLNTGIAFSQAKQPKIIIVTFDGLRWKDMFRGADSALLLDHQYNPSKDSLQRRAKYGGKTPQERRANLMPFMWNTVANHGQLYGNRDQGSYVNVKNTFRISYPGYNEMFSGYPDSLVRSNDNKPNPNVTVQEFVNKQPGFQNKVATFASWFTFNGIMNKERCGFPVNAGFTKLDGKLTPAQSILNEEQFWITRPYAPSERPDAVTYLMAREYLKQNHPRLLQISFIETDASAHRGYYDAYLDAMHNGDAMLANLWETIQADPFYKDQTTLYIAVDHGRGDMDKWKNHGSSIVNADQIWFAVMGPQTKPSNGSPMKGQFFQYQHAKTIAALLGLNFTSPHPIGEVLNTVVGK
jgi:hypothetical protein